MRPFLLGRTPVEDVERVLGRSPSGTENLDFYRVLVRRNYHKFLGDLFGTVATLAKRQHDGLWSELVDGFIAAHPPGHWNPNRVGALFPRYLAEIREQRPSIPELWEQMADYHWNEFLAGSAVDDGSDGFDQWLFVRQYGFPIPEFIRKLRDDPATPVPEPTPIIVVLYRSHLNNDLRLLFPSPVALAVLAQRQGVALPPGFPAVDDARKTAVALELVDLGVFRGPNVNTGPG